jgi:hypothetical protein
MANVYNRGKLVMADGTLGSSGWTSAGADVGVLLVAAGYAYDPDHNFVSDITNELSGGGYARQTGLTGRAATEDDANDRVSYDAANTVFASLDAAAGQPVAAIVYNNAPGTDATRHLIAHVVLSAPPAPNGGDYTITWDAAGVLNLGE